MTRPHAYVGATEDQHPLARVPFINTPSTWRGRCRCGYCTPQRPSKQQALEEVVLHVLDGNTEWEATG